PIYTVLAADTTALNPLGQVAAGLEALVTLNKPIEAGSPTGKAPYTVSASGGSLSIADANGFWFGLKQTVAQAAAVLKTGTLSSTTTFDDATVTLSGTPTAGDVWMLTLIDSS